MSINKDIVLIASIFLLLIFLCLRTMQLQNQIDEISSKKCSIDFMPKKASKDWSIDTFHRVLKVTK